MHSEALHSPLYFLDVVMMQSSTQCCLLTGSLLACALVAVVAIAVALIGGCTDAGCYSLVHIEVKGYGVASPFHGNMHATTEQDDVTRDFNFVCHKTAGDAAGKTESRRKYLWCPEQPMDVAHIDIYIPPPHSVEIKLWTPQQDSNTTLFDDTVELNHYHWDPNGRRCGPTCTLGVGRVALQQDSAGSNWQFVNILAWIPSSWFDCGGRPHRWSCEGDVDLETLFPSNDAEEEQEQEIWR